MPVHSDSPATGSAFRLPLSVCLIVKNEAAVLRRCLESISPYAAETIIVDTGSTDATIQIARAHGAQVHSFSWCDDYAAARNAALDRASQPWIMMLDADEWLPAASLARLMPMLPRIQGPALLKGMRHSDDSEVNFMLPYVWNRQSEGRFVGRVVEMVRCKPETQVFLCPGMTVINRRLGWNESMMANRLAYYTKLMALALDEGSVTPEMRIMHAEYRFQAGDPTDGVQQLMMVINDPVSRDDARSEASTRLANHLLGLGDLHGAESLIGILLQRRPHVLMNWLVGMKIAEGAGDSDLAMTRLAECLRLDRAGLPQPMSLRHWNTGYWLNAMATVQDRCNRPDRAARLRLAAETEPCAVNIRSALERFLRTGDVQGACDWYDWTLAPSADATIARQTSMDSEAARAEWLRGYLETGQP